MRFKRAMAASMAAVMAISSAVVCQITASAEGETTLFNTKVSTGKSVKIVYDISSDDAVTWDAVDLIVNTWNSAANKGDYIKYGVGGADQAQWYNGNFITYSKNATDQELTIDLNYDPDGNFAILTKENNGKYNLLVKTVTVYSGAGGTGDVTYTWENPELDKTEYEYKEIPIKDCEVFPGTFDFSKFSGKSAGIEVSFEEDGDNHGIKFMKTDESGTSIDWSVGDGLLMKSGSSPIFIKASEFDGLPEKLGFNGWGIKKDSNVIIKIKNEKGKGNVYTDVVNVSSLTISGAPETITYGDAAFKLTAAPNEGATLEDGKLTWESSAPDVAEIATDGTVTITGAGKATITATYGEVKQTVDLTVAQKAVTMTIKTSDVTDATVDDAQTKAEDSIVLSTAVTPLSPDDYELTVKLADDKKSYTASVALTEKGKTKYALTCEPAGGKITYKVTGLKLSTDKLPILASNTDGVQLTATVLPADLAEGDIEWTTADNTVATVENGLVKPVSGSAGGKTTITASVKGTDVKATCEVSIVEEVNLAVSIKLDKEELSGTAGDKAELKADVTAQDTSKDCTSIVVWKSSDEKVATVSNGVVTFVGEGTAEITATAGDVSAVCKVTVKAKTVAVEKVTLDKTSAELTVGDTATLKASVTPDNATDKTVTWTSSDDSVASVKDGVVTAVKAGTATITAKSGDKTATCTVTVKDKKIIFSGKADIKPTELNSWNDNVQISAANVEETSVIRIRYSIIDGAQHQIKVQDGADWKVLTSIKTNEWGVTEVSKDGVLVIKLNKADAEAVAKGGLAITGIGIRVEDVDFNVVEDSKKYPASTATKTEFVKTTVNSDNTLNMLAVFSISEEDAKNFEAFLVTVQRSSDSKIYYDIVETYYDAFDYTADGVMHEGVSENGKHLIVLNLVNADPSWGSITVKIEPAVPKG